VTLSRRLIPFLGVLRSSLLLMRRRSISKFVVQHPKSATTSNGSQQFMTYEDNIFFSDVKRSKHLIAKETNRNKQNVIALHLTMF